MIYINYLHACALLKLQNYNKEGYLSGDVLQFHWPNTIMVDFSESSNVM